MSISYVFHDPQAMTDVCEDTLSGLVMIDRHHHECELHISFLYSHDHDIFYYHNVFRC